MASCHVDDRHDRTLRASGLLAAGVELVRERLDDARAQAAACALVAVVTPPDAVVGYRQSPTGAVNIVSHHDLTLVIRGERMLKGVDHELGGNEPEAHRLAGFHGAGHGLHEERMRAAVINHRVSKAVAQLRQIGTDFDTVAQPRGLELLLHGCYRHHPLVCVPQVLPRFLRLHRSRLWVMSSIASRSRVESGCSSSNTWRALSSMVRRPMVGNSCSTS